MKIDLFSDYDPHPGQVAVHAASERFLLGVAGRRWGKDFAFARKFVKNIFMRDYPKIAQIKMPSHRFVKYAKPLLHYWAIAPDFPIGKIQQREIFSIFPQEFQANDAFFNYDDNKKELRLLGNRILIEFKSADRPDSLVGVGLNGVYITEFARLKETAWSANIRPTLTDKLGWGVFTTTPLPRQWFMDIVSYGDPKSERYSPAHRTIFGKTIDNIRLPGIVEEVAVAKATLPIRYFRREYEASLDMFEGQVYEDWNPEVHCKWVPPSFDMVIAGVDWGYSAPGCILVAGVKFTKGFPVFYMLDESYEAGVLIDGPDDSWVNRAMRLKLQYNISTFYCDTEEPAYIQAFRNHGLNAVGADKDVQAGIQSVATAMHVGETDGVTHLFVNAENCPNLVRQNRQYQYAKDETPLKEDDHAVDPERYLIHTFVKRGGIQAYEHGGEWEDRV